MSVTDLSKAKEERTPHCEYCGKKEHKGVYECPRIKAIEYRDDGETICIRFWGPGDVPNPGRGVVADWKI